MKQPISYYSTNLHAKSVTFRDALLKGLAPDRGLYMPEAIPVLSPDELRSFSGKPYAEIAYAVSRKFLHSEIPDAELRAIVKDAYNFPVPLEQVYDRKYVMRLDQGPTASFKDFAARMMGRLMQYFLTQEQRKLLILTATSGDTGSAIANAFYGLDNIKVLVLFPEKEVTDRQRKQMATLHHNIQILALDGKFDDCQALVKQAFNDPDLDYLHLSSANSINIGRLLPQIIYYIYAFAHLRHGDEEVIFSVPSGNFGDLMGGLLAKQMGLPVKKFLVVTNENHEFPTFVETGKYEKIVPSINCVSSAMNVGHPSNVARLIALYGGEMDETGHISKTPDLDAIRRDMYAVSISDAQTKAAIKTAYDNHRLLLEPHGAVAWAGLMHYLHAQPQHDTPDQLYISLETAHPAKFPQEIREILDLDPDLPPSLEGLEEHDESYVTMTGDYQEFKHYLQETY
ncbi:threonine synthase [candidate division KSB3 bacterium]|uniref:Threonine synthase n=1 Tax=candidate division KSB3 bacterium TaxID=2044937 RepID=A0A9D5JVF7_9BACT|nr:threonine synthase [candidate division KSB3 bacterium]MBD3324890.1 threonine synthase [candidate division KSB3 bacterium]